MYESLGQILNTSTDQAIPERYGRDYIWERMTYDAKAIREHHAHREFLGHVKVHAYDIPEDIRHYAESIQGITEAYEYEDRSILLCAVCNEFAGTFASHEDTEIHFFLLTPKTV